MCVQDDVLEVVEGTQADRLFLDGSLPAPGGQRDRTPTTHDVAIRLHPGPLGSRSLRTASDVRSIGFLPSIMLADDGKFDRARVSERDHSLVQLSPQMVPQVDGRTRLPIL